MNVKGIKIRLRWIIKTNVPEDKILRFSISSFRYGNIIWVRNQPPHQRDGGEKVRPGYIIPT